MTFEPIGENHAIQDVGFTLIFDTNFTETDMGRISQAGSAWAEFLPKEERTQIFGFSIGKPVDSMGMPLPPPVAPIMFSRINIDGNLGWQLMFSDNQISIRCAVYTRWNDVWGSAKTILLNAISAISEEGRNLKNLNLQTRDVFEWKGNIDELSPEMLFKIDGEFFPQTARNFGKNWHLHNGYFENKTFGGIESLKNISTLNRTHIDSVTQRDRQLVIIDHVLRADLDDALPTTTIASEADNDYLNVIFTEMHSMNKRTIAGLINDSMQERISLNA